MLINRLQDEIWVCYNIDYKIKYGYINRSITRLNTGIIVDRLRDQIRVFKRSIIRSNAGMLVDRLKDQMRVC